MKVEAWVVFKATRTQYGGLYPAGSPYAGQRKIGKITMTKVYQNKPQVADDEIVMRMELEVPEESFLEGTATIKATVPAPDPNDHEIQAHVDRPVRGRAKSAAAAVIQP